MKRTNGSMIAMIAMIAMIVILSGTIAGCTAINTMAKSPESMTLEEREDDRKLAGAIDLIGALITDIINAGSR